ncbi:hypothetical protein AtDm6_1827 [Acetobacter tropicalis]|uniref:Uncharacterized protein n=1 Tax=Acetobacter tropicalis TaxID=104102 RepID=A0A095B1W0_9PROT|nr:hypothetical protein AtDm6_1827 [Acetobacter tropicalis]
MGWPEGQVARLWHVTEQEYASGGMTARGLWDTLPSSVPDLWKAERMQG